MLKKLKDILTPKESFVNVIWLIVVMLHFLSFGTNLVVAFDTDWRPIPTFNVIGSGFALGAIIGFAFIIRYCFNTLEKARGEYAKAKALNDGTIAMSKDLMSQPYWEDKGDA